MSSDYAKYKAYYDAYEESPKGERKRVERNRNRRAFLREGRVHKGDKEEIDHIHALAKGGDDRPSNLRVISQHANRVKYINPA